MLNILNIVHKTHINVIEILVTITCITVFCNKVFNEVKKDFDHEWILKL